MNSITQILWGVAEEIERYGVTRLPRYGHAESCPVYAVLKRTSWLATPTSYKGIRSFDHARLTLSFALMGKAIGVRGVASEIADWNDAQPSRAVVAAAMRDAAQLASWAGDYLARTVGISSSPTAKPSSSESVNDPKAKPAL